MTVKWHIRTITTLLICHFLKMLHLLTCSFTAFVWLTGQYLCCVVCTAVSLWNLGNSKSRHALAQHYCLIGNSLRQLRNACQNWNLWTDCKRRSLVTADKQRIWATHVNSWCSSYVRLASWPCSSLNSTFCMTEYTITWLDQSLLSGDLYQTWNTASS